MSSFTTRVVEMEGVDVHIKEPTATPAGITFIIPGTIVPLDKYETIGVFLADEKQHVVLIFFNNVFAVPPGDKAVQRVKGMFETYRKSEWKYESAAPTTFSVVGHSTGAKIAVMLATTADTPIANVVAFDPVDLNPVVFTDKDSVTPSVVAATSLNITWATGTWDISIPPAHNPLAVYTALEAMESDSLKPLVRYVDASHFGYCDNRGGLLRFIMCGGTKEGNANCRAMMFDLLNDVF